MAKIQAETYVITLSRLTKDVDVEPLPPVLDDDQIETLRAAIEGLVDNEAVVVEAELA